MQTSPAIYIVNNKATELNKLKLQQQKRLRLTQQKFFQDIKLLESAATSRNQKVEESHTELFLDIKREFEIDYDQNFQESTTFTTNNASSYPGGLGTQTF